MSDNQSAFGMLPASIMERTDLSVNEKYMLIVLASFASRTGECWPSVATLAERSALSDRYVKMLLARLAEVGLVVSERRGRRSNMYRLVWLSEVNQSTPQTYGEQSFPSNAYGEQSFTPYGEQSFPTELTNRTYQEHITSDHEKQVLETLRSVPLYAATFEIAKELQFVRDLVTDYPNVDVLVQVKKWKAYKLDVPLERNSRPHSQLRTWMEKCGDTSAPAKSSRRGDGLTDEEYNDRLFKNTAL